MKGTIHDVAEGPNGRLTALVQLDGEDLPREVHYWPELLEQWQPDKLRRYLVDQARIARDDEVRAAAAGAVADAHLAQLAGDADADPQEFAPPPEPVGERESDGQN